MAGAALIILAAAALGVSISLGVCVYLYGWTTLVVPVSLGLIGRGVVYVVDRR